MLTIVVLLINLLIVNFLNKSLANKIPVKYDLRSDIGELSSCSDKEQGSLKDSTIIQLKSHIKLGKKSGKYSSFTDDILNKLEFVEKNLNYKVKGIFPLYKEQTSNGINYYKDTNGTEASADDIKEQRETMKHIIMNNGGIIAYISKSGIKDIDNGDKVCYSRNITTAMGDLAVVIIGWDDDFSKEKFDKNCRPTSNGAFLVQSYDEVFYVSYEDIYVENNLRYIDSIEEYEVGKEQTESTKTEEPVNPVKSEEPVEHNKQEQPVEPTSQEEPIVVEKSEGPSEITMVETGSDTPLEVDTSIIENIHSENNSNNNINSNNLKESKTSNIEYVNPKTVTSGKLPQTGSNTEIILVITIAAIMFIAFIIHAIKDVVESDKETL